LASVSESHGCAIRKNARCGVKEMKMICPLCNGLRNLQVYTCPGCGHDMQDQGRVSGFFGPYSPYEELEAANNLYEKCVHLISCPRCGNDFKVNIDLVEM